MGNVTSKRQDFAPGIKRAAAIAGVKVEALPDDVVAAINGDAAPVVLDDEHVEIPKPDARPSGNGRSVWPIMVKTAKEQRREKEAAVAAKSPPRKARRGSVFYEMGRVARAEGLSPADFATDANLDKLVADTAHLSNYPECYSKQAVDFLRGLLG